MKCEETSEFISAICDGQTIPPEAAEHIGQCESCRTQSSEYLELGAELRRFASLESVGEIRVIHWEKSHEPVQVGGEGEGDCANTKTGFCAAFSYGVCVGL